MSFISRNILLKIMRLFGVAQLSEIDNPAQAAINWLAIKLWNVVIHIIYYFSEVLSAHACDWAVIHG